MSSVERPQHSPNDRLREAMSEAGLTTEQLANKLQVDRKTVERWITTGRVPYPTHRFAVEDALKVEASELWPGLRPKAPRSRTQPQPNERLRRAIFNARLTFEQVSERLEVDTKTVERWVTKGTPPYPVHRQALSVTVGVSEEELWPEPTERRAKRGHRPRAATPRDGTTIQTSARLRSCMSWVDANSPLKERDIHPHREPERNRDTYSRGHGVERT